MPISFHRSLCSFPTLDEVCPIQDNLHHPYVAMVAAGGTALPTIQRGLEPVEREHTPVGSPLPAPVPEGVNAPSPATRFLLLLHEELRPSSYVLPRDSEGFLILSGPSRLLSDRETPTPHCFRRLLKSLSSGPPPASTPTT